jgi:ribosomal protein S18 acetylase RimI-like enzyme
MINASVFWLILSLLYLFSLNAETFFTKGGEAVQFQECSSEETALSDQEQMKELFAESFAKGFHLSGAYLDLSEPALVDYLREDFEVTLRPMLYEKKLFLGAKVGERLVGYALFEQIAEDTIYVAELGIASDYWGQGLGTKMTLFYADKNPHIKKVVLLTEKINLMAQKFYEEIGFQHSSYMHEGYSAERFCAYEKTVR